MNKDNHELIILIERHEEFIVSRELRRLAGAMFKSHLALVDSHAVNQTLLKSIFTSLVFDSTPLSIANKIPCFGLA